MRATDGVGFTEVPRLRSVRCAPTRTTARTDINAPVSSGLERPVEPVESHPLPLGKGRGGALKQEIERGQSARAG